MNKERLFLKVCQTNHHPAHQTQSEIDEIQKYSQAIDQDFHLVRYDHFLKPKFCRAHSQLLEEID